jgi:hypothetical protein
MERAQSSGNAGPLRLDRSNEASAIADTLCVMSDQEIKKLRRANSGRRRRTPPRHGTGYSQLAADKKLNVAPKSA